MPAYNASSYIEKAAQSILGQTFSEDGRPNSMLEAMAMGSLPIQSDTACIEGWLEDGQNAFVVPP